MANVIIPKRSSVAAKAPLTTDLQVGEIAVNLADAKIYSKNASGTVIQLGASGTVVGPGTVTDSALSVFDGTTGNLLKAASVFHSSVSGVLQFGGKTNTFTGLRNNASVLEARWADNSGYADFRCAGLTAASISSSSWFNFSNYFAMNSISGNLYMANGGRLGWSSGLSVSPTSSHDVYFTRDGSSTISVLGAAAASFNVYNTFTDGTTYERGVLSWSSNVFKIGTQRGTSGTARSVAIITDGLDRVIVDNAGGVGIGGAPTAGVSLQIEKSITGATNAYQVYGGGVIQSDVTGVSGLYVTVGSTVAASFTLGSLNHFWATQGTIGAGSSVTNQYGFNVASTLTGATNNFGFYSNIASGAGRYNFYAAGTADNYFGGPVQIRASSTSNALQITQTGTGNALVVEDSTPDSTPFVVDASGRLIVGSTTALTYSNSSPNVPNLQINALGSATAGISRFSPNSAGNSCWFLKSRGATAGAFDVVASGDTLGTIGFLGADGTDGIPAATISAQVDGTPGTNDMPGRLVFSTTADGASSPTERMRIDNQGRVGIGGTAGADTQLQLLGTYVTSGAVTRVVRANGTIPSSTTGTARIYGTEITTQAASFTVLSLQHFYAAQAALGLGSAVTNQYGFLAEASLTGATNNYGFYSNIASGTGRYNFYAAGTASNYLGGDLTFKPLESATPANNGDLTFQATSNTSLTIKFKGSDGVVRSASLTLA